MLLNQAHEDLAGDQLPALHVLINQLGVNTVLFLLVTQKLAGGEMVETKITHHVIALTE